MKPAKHETSNLPAQTPSITFQLSPATAEASDLRFSGWDVIRTIDSWPLCYIELQNFLARNEIWDFILKLLIHCIDAGRALTQQFSLGTASELHHQGPRFAVGTCGQFQRLDWRITAPVNHVVDQLTASKSKTRGKHLIGNAEFKRLRSKVLEKSGHRLFF